MPIPTPSSGETQDEFIARCMDNSTMVSEYPDEEQRYAICQSAWDNRNSLMLAYLSYFGVKPCQIMRILKKKT